MASVPERADRASAGGGECSSGARLKNAAPFDGVAITGLRCGEDIQNAATEEICIFTISPEGDIYGSWGPS